MARLTLRTRVAASLFFLTCLIFVFYLNLNSCTATMLLWLGLGPMHVRLLPPPGFRACALRARPADAAHWELHAGKCSTACAAPAPASVSLATSLCAPLGPRRSA